MMTLRFCRAMRLILVASLAASSGARIGNAAAGQEKQVLALQAFLDSEISERIRTICLQAAAIEGAEVAFSWGAVPHLTISAWRVTPVERQDAFKSLHSPPARALVEMTFSCRLEQIENDGMIEFYLIPTEDSKTSLSTFRDRALLAIGADFEDFQGRSGKDWWPHVTLFSVPVSEEPAALEFASQLEDIDEIHLNKLALVGFENGIRTLDALHLSSDR